MIPWKHRLAVYSIAYWSVHFLTLTVKASLPESKLLRTLNCNIEAELSTKDDCVSWKEIFGDVPQQNNEIVIPCGECVNLDVEGPLELVQGLNIIGKLIISKPIDINTPYVVVQGELHIISKKQWDGTQDITITLTGTSDNYVMLADSNMDTMHSKGCKIGKKAFVVAGGKLLIDGLPSVDYETPTWVHLQDTMTSQSTSNKISIIEAYPGVVDLPEECNADGTLIDEDFSNPSKPSSAYHVESSLGSSYVYTENSLKVLKRSDVSHGPVFDLIEVMKCIKPDVRYQVNARVRTYQEGADPNEIQESDCSANGSGCLDIIFEWKRENGSTDRDYPYHEEESYGWRYGEEITISETITFDEDMIDSSNIHSIFHFYGLEANVVIEVYEFQLKLAPESAYRTASDVCTDLALPNGDAELDRISPFPYKADAYSTNVFVTQDEDNLSNHYFAISGRGNSVHHSLRWDIGVGCMITNAVYRINIDYRLHSNTQYPKPESYGFRVRLKVKREERDDWFTMARCVNSEDGNGVWKNCDQIFTVPQGVVKEGDLEYEIVLETERTINYDIDNISIVQTSGPINAIVLEDSVEEKWAVGAEVLITSHTNKWDEEQVRTIAKIESSDESGFVNIFLNATIRAPTTMKDDNMYATEVAILSRNIRIQGANDDPDVLHGGHLMIMATPGDGQDVVGLEVRNMGQAGNLGRYPLHFHLCGNVTGSRLAKNLIRDTNQRCAVVHGTDHALVDNNVAYNTFGHCFMVEDGMERFNTFSNNLGAKTKKATQLIPNLPTKNNGDETDESAATFWITNPMNFFVNNVAAGGQSSGFWFELRSRPRGSFSEMYTSKEWSLRQMSLGAFKGNVAHSYDSAGIKTYPHGYVPDNVAVFEDSRSYRNDGNGMFIHNSRNITLSGFHFADNEQGVDLDRIDLFEMHDSVIVGRSKDYKAKVVSQSAPNVCGGNPTYIRGVEMHTFQAATGLKPSLQGKFKNVTFSGFNDTGCTDSAVFWADDEVRVGTWNYWTTLEDSTADDGSEGYIANFCRAVNVGIKDSYIIDKSSAFGNAVDSIVGPSTIMTYTKTHTKMQTFIEPTLCNDNPENCYSYCENTCLRTVSFRMDPAPITEKYRLKICKKKDQLNRCDIFNSRYDNDSRLRIFSPALPAGSYNAEFLDDVDQITWPRGVNITYEPDMCEGGGLLKDDIELTIPEVDPVQCDNLISNGDAEASTTTPIHWTYERNTGIEIQTSVGINGSNAFGDIRVESHDGGLTQHLDTRCLSLHMGRQYEVKAYVKLIDKNGKPLICDPSIHGGHSCARIILNYGRFRRENEHFLRDQEIEAGITRARNVNQDGYQLVNGIITINNDLADASNVRLFIERRFNNMEMLVDDISMKIVSESTCDGEDYELVTNGDFDGGTSMYWNDYDAEGLKIVSPGVGGVGYALDMKTGTAQHSLKSQCIVAGKRYLAQAKYRLLDMNGDRAFCNPRTNNPRCPEMSLDSYNENNKRIDYMSRIAKPLDDTANTDDGFSSIWGIFTATDLTEAAADVRIHFRYTGKHMIVDNVSVKEIGSSCGDLNDLIINGDNEMGVLGFWTGSGVSMDKITTTDGFGGTGKAVRVTGRTRSYSGMWWEGQQWVNKESCLTQSSRWKLSAQVRLLEPGTDNGVDCDTSQKANTASRCPRFRVRFHDSTDPYTAIREEIVYSYINDWDKDSWNEFKAQIEVPSTGFSNLNKIIILVSDVRENVDIAIDDLSMIRVS